MKNANAVYLFFSARWQSPYPYELKKNTVYLCSVKKIGNFFHTELSLFISFFMHLYLRKYDLTMCRQIQIELSDNMWKKVLAFFRGSIYMLTLTLPI